MEDIEGIEKIQITKTIYVKKVTYKEFLEITAPQISTNLVQKDIGNRIGYMSFEKIGDYFVPYGLFSETIEGLRGCK